MPPYYPSIKVCIGVPPQQNCGELQVKMSPADCIALEDSHNGLRSALAAGIKTYITTNPYTRKQDFTGAAAVFDDLSDLPNFYLTIGLPKTIC